MKKFVIFIFIAILILIIIILINDHTLNDQYLLSNKIIEFIDNNADKNNTCTLLMTEVTDFKWDKMLMYQIGSTNQKISEALGINYNKSVDMYSGIIFVYEGKIVYEETKLYNPDKIDELTFYVGQIFNSPEYKVYTPNDAYFKCNKNISGGDYYYEISPLNN